MKKKLIWRTKLPPTILKTMKLTLVFMLACIMHVSANVFSQNTRVSLACNQETVKDIFKKISNQTNLDFFYSGNEINSNERKTVNFDNEQLDVVMKTILGNKYDYSVIDNLIIIQPANPLKSQDSEKILIKGIVKDADNLPLPGVSVCVKGTTNGVATDLDGTYKFSFEKTKSPIIIEFSFVGMKTVAVKYTGQKVIDVVLVYNSEELEEVVVTNNGYQKIDRRLFTGSATKISAEDAKVDGVPDVGRMLEGKVAGVSVQNVSGTFGAAPKIRVRGASSIYGDTKPLWVVDGIILEDVVDIAPDDLSSGDAKTLISSSIAGLNADDIEDFQVLKDASATAMYGARAMNGVICITTKKGVPGKTTFRVSSEMTVRTKPRYEDYDILNSQEQMSMLRELETKGWMTHSDMMRSKDGGIFYKMYDRINTYDRTTGKYVLINTPEARADYLRQYEKANTDWFNILFKNSIQQNHSVSFSGGSETSRFYVSTSFLHDDGWTVADKVDRYTINMNGDFNITDKLKVGVQTKGSIRNQTTPGTFDRTNDVVNGTFSREFDINPFSYALNTSRTIRPYDSNGDYEFFRMNYADFNVLNEYKNNVNELNVLDLSIQGNADYKFSKKLNYTFSGAIRYVKSTGEHKVMENSNVVNAYKAGVDDPVISKSNRYLYVDPENPNAIPVGVLPHGGFYNREDDLLVNYYFRNIVNWNDNFNEAHILNVLIGQELKYVDRKGSSFNGYGYQYDKGGVVYTDPNIIKSTVQSGFNYFNMEQFYDRSLSAFANVGYSFDGKYTFNCTGRIDGSNKLGEAQSARWLPTWNLSGKWDIKSESFMQNIDYISFLSVRGTYGLTASMGRATNSKIIYRNTTTVTPYDSEKQNGMYIESLENSDLTWEKQYETNVGMDIGFLNNRISFQVDAYKRKSFDLIAKIRTSGIGGEAWKMANYADMKSNGIEFTLNTKNIVYNDFSWVTNCTFSYNKNEITKLNSKPMIYDLVKAEGDAIIGGPVRGLYSIPFAGLDANGLPQFYDAEGNIVNEIYFQDDNTDFLKYEGSIDPKYTGGVSNQIAYKSFKLNVFCTYQFGNVIRLYPSFHASYSDMDAITRDMKNRWVVKGDEKITNIPKLLSYREYDTYDGNIESVYNSYNYSDQRVAKGDFVRLKEVSLSYALPTKLIKKVGLNKAELKAQGTNLLLLYSDSKLNGQDPEFFGTGGVAMPVPHQYTLTLKLGF